VVTILNLGSHQREKSTKIETLLSGVITAVMVFLNDLILYTVSTKSKPNVFF